MASSSLPYPGLRSFEEQDHWLFFGREAQVSAMLHHLDERRFVAVIGASGSGKSSLVRAGLIPAVRAGFLEDSKDWLIATIRPGRDPYQRLARELTRAARAPKAAPLAAAIAANAVAGKEDVSELKSLLAGSDKALPLALDSLGWRGNTMIVVDQFEEIFGFRRESARGSEVAPRDEAAAFVSMLLNSSSSPSNRIWVVLTMRSDFIGDCETFLGLPEAVSQSQFLVPRLDRRQMEEAIRRPGEACNEGLQAFTCQDGLVKQLINDAGDRPDQLPLLQHVLMRMWKLASKQRGQEGHGDEPVQLTLDHYRQTGGIRHALSEHADAAWLTIRGDPVLAPIARTMFLLLCDVSPDGQITRRRPKVSQVMRVARASIDEVTKIVQQFNADDRSFIAFEGDFGPDTVIDLSHEALLRQWHIFRETWLAEERADVFELRLLAELSKVAVNGQLGSAHLDRALGWRKRVTREWALRYVSADEWESLLSFVDSAVRARRLQRRLREAGIATVSLALVGIAIAGTWVGYSKSKASATLEISKQAALRSNVETKAALAQAISARAVAEAAKASALVSADKEHQAEAALQTRNDDLQAALREADRAKSRATAEALWHPLVGSSDAQAELARDNALLKVAQSPFGVRQQFIEEGWSDPTLARQLAKGADMIDASVGVSPRMREVLLSKLAARPASAGDSSDVALAQRFSRLILSQTADFDSTLAGIASPNDSASCGVLASRLARVSGSVPSARLLSSIDRLLAGITDINQPVPCDAYGAALKSLAERLDATNAAAAASDLLNAIPDVKNPMLLRDIDHALTAASQRIPADEAPAFTSKALAALDSGDIKTTNGQLAAAHSVLMTAKYVRDPDLVRALRAIKLATTDSDDTMTEKVLAELEALLVRLPTTDASAYARDLVESRRNASIFSPPIALNKATILAVQHLPPEEAGALAMSLLTTMPQADSQGTSIFETNGAAPL